MADKDIENINNTLSLMKERVDELKERIRLGKSRENEVYVIESQVASLVAQKEKFAGDRSKYTKDMSRLLGTSADMYNYMDDTAGSGEIKELSDYLDLALKQREEIELAKQDVSIQEIKKRVSSGLLYPSVRLDGSWYFSRNSLNGSNWDTNLYVDVPLFQGGIVRNKIKEDTAKLSELNLRVKLVEREINAEIRQLYAAAVYSKNQRNSYAEAYGKSEKSYQLQLKDYRLGLVNNIDVLQSMVLLLDVKRNLDKSQVQFKMDRLLLELAAE